MARLSVDRPRDRISHSAPPSRRVPGVTTLLLVRHGLTEVTGSTLAGWTPDLHLDERGRAQAAALGARLAPVPLAAIVSSPLDRCRETAEAVLTASGREQSPEKLDLDERL